MTNPSILQLHWSSIEYHSWTSLKHWTGITYGLALFMSQFMTINKCVWCWLTVFLLLMLCQVAKHKSSAMSPLRFWETKVFPNCPEWELQGSWTSSSSTMNNRTVNNRSDNLCNHHEISAKSKSSVLQLCHAASSNRKHALTIALFAKCR